MVTEKDEKREEEIETLVEKKEPAAEAERVKPLDGGWGWCIVLGVMIQMFFTVGLGRSFTLIYLSILDRFQESDTVTSLTMSIQQATHFLITILSGTLSNRYSARSLVLIGCCFLLAGLLTVAYTQSIFVVYLGYGLLQGISMAFRLTPASVLLNKYFKKKKSMAFGIANASKGIASFTLPPLVALLLNHYAWSGTFLVLAALSSHTFISVFLFRPLEDNFPRMKRRSILSVVETKPQNEKCTDHAEVELKSFSANQSFSEKRDEELDENNHKKINGSKTPQTKRKQPLLHLSLLKHCRFVLFITALSLYNFSVTSMMFLAPLGKEYGFTLQQITITIISFGVADLLGSILIGLIFDLKVIRNNQYHACWVVLFINGLGSFLLGLSKNYFCFISAVVIKGITVNVVWMKVPIMSKIIGDEKVGSGIAISSPLLGIGTFVGPVIAGLLKDYFNSYTYIMHYAGVCIVLGAMVMCVGGLFQKCRRSKEDRHTKRKSIGV